MAIDKPAVLRIDTEHQRRAISAEEIALAAGQEPEVCPPLPGDGVLVLGNAFLEGQLARVEIAAEDGQEILVTGP